MSEAGDRPGSGSEQDTRLKKNIENKKKIIRFKTTLFSICSVSLTGVLMINLVYVVVGLRTIFLVFEVHNGD